MLKGGIFTSAFLFFFSFFPFCFRTKTRSRSSSPAPDLFPIYLFIYFLRLPCHRRPRRPGRRCHGLRLEKTLRLRRDCLPRSRSIGPEAPSFLRGAILSYLESDRNFQSSPEVGDTSSKPSCRHFSLPWCTPYVNVKLSRACAELKITYQLYGLSIRNPIRKVRIAKPLY